MLKLSKISIPYTSVRLNLLVVCETVLLLLSALAVLFFFSRQALREEAMRDAEQTLEVNVRHIDNILMTVEEAAYNICQDLQAHLDQPERMADYCRQLVECNPDVNGCAVAFKPYYYKDRELFMTYVHRSGGEKGGGSLVTSWSFGSQPYTEQEWFKAPAAKGHACWVGPLGEEEDEGVTLSFCLPIYDGEVCVGTFVADLPISLLSQIVHSAKPSPNSYSVLLSSNGTYIVHPDAQKLLKPFTVFAQAAGEADLTLKEVAESMVSGETGYRSFRLNNEDWYVFYKPFSRFKNYVQPMDKVRWSVGVIYPEDDIFGDYYQLIMLVLAITVVGLLLFYVLCRVVIRRQMEPLRHLARSAQRIAEGKYDEPIPEPQRDDEIGQLEKHFRKMQRSLANKSGELERMTARLTKRSEELRKAYGQAQGSDRMKTTFLHYMTTQMTVPSDLIERSVMKLSNHYDEISAQEADYEVEVIKTQSEVVLDLLDHMIEALTIEAEEADREVRERKEDSHE